MWYAKKITAETISLGLAFVKKFEPLCVNLASVLLGQQKYFNTKKTSVKKSQNQKIISFIFFHNTEIAAVCAVDGQKTFLHCFPNVTETTMHAFFSCTKSFFDEVPIRSIMGEKKCSDFIESYLVAAHQYRRKRSEAYFLLTLSAAEFLKQPSPQDTDIRCAVCTQSDVEKLLPLQFGYEREELERTTQNEFFSRLYLLNMLGEQTLFKGEINGTIVAKAHTNACGIRCKQIGGVYTLPTYRRHHCAEAVLRFAFQTLSACTDTFVLFVKVKNDPAQKLYRRLGFKKKAAFVITTFETNV